MLRNRSRAVSSKQGLMTDQTSQSPPPTRGRNYPDKPIPSFFYSSRFKPFTYNGAVGLPEAEAEPVTMSPTSILDPTTKPLIFTFQLGNIWNDINKPKSPKQISEHAKAKHYSSSRDQNSLVNDTRLKGIGVALIDDDALIKSCELNSTSRDDGRNNFSSSTCKPNNRPVVLYGTKLGVQIPPLPNSTQSPAGSPISPADFGTKTRNAQFSAPAGCFQRKDSPAIAVTTGCLDRSELESSEDYTCVISHGPNPKTTHIFDNCIMEDYSSSSDDSNSAASLTDFLSFCYTCRKNLQHKSDIYIYRGEKAFCSCECRYEEMLLDEMES